MTHTTFSEVMEGTVRLGGRERPMRLELDVDLPEVFRPWGDTEGSLRGHVRVPGWADDPAARGTLRVAPLAARRIRYRLDFTTPDGQAMHLDGWKSINLHHPLRSMTHLPATIRDEKGEAVGEARLRFDVRRDLAAFLTGFRFRTSPAEPPTAAGVAGADGVASAGNVGSADRVGGVGSADRVGSAMDESGGLLCSRWRGQTGRLEVWYTTLTDPATGTGVWIHHELVAPSDGRAPYAHGWAVLFPPGESPVLGRFGPHPWTPSPAFAVPGVELRPARPPSTHAAGRSAEPRPMADSGPPRTGPQDLRDDTSADADPAGIAGTDYQTPRPTGEPGRRTSGQAGSLPQDLAESDRDTPPYRPGGETGPLPQDLAGSDDDAPSYRLSGEAGSLSWDLVGSGGGAPLYTFPRWAWRRELLPAAQVVPAPGEVFDGTVRCGDRVLDVRNAPGATARIYGHGNARRWAWLHADLGGGDVCEVVAAVSTRRGLDRLPPLPFVRLRVGGVEWPGGDGLLAATRMRATIGLPSWKVSGRSGDRMIRVEVTQPPGATVAVDYTDPDGSAAVCHNSERADAVITLLRRDGKRWELDRRWHLEGTAHAEVGLR
jgi:hypothetical protein